VGHWIAGQGKRGAKWFVAGLLFSGATLTLMAVPALSPGLLVLIPLNLVAMIAVFVDAFLCGRRSAQPMLRTPPIRYLAGVGLIVAGFVFSTGLTRALLPIVHGLGIQTFIIPTGSMVPTLQPHDRILTNRTKTLNRWDLVAYRPPVNPGEVFVARIVGLPGEKVEIVKGGIQIDGKHVEVPAGAGPYVKIGRTEPDVGGEGNPITLTADEYFLLGDNSRIAYDGRLWRESTPGHQRGAVPRESIEAKVTSIYFPLNRIRRLR
jgi:signal peptidase I